MSQEQLQACAWARDPVVLLARIELVGVLLQHAAIPFIGPSPVQRWPLKEVLPECFGHNRTIPRHPVSSRHIGSSPLDLITAAAAGVRRNLISASTASGAVDVAGTTALNTMACWSSGGSGVASTPATVMSSGICWAAISTSPL